MHSHILMPYSLWMRSVFQLIGDHHSSHMLQNRIFPSDSCHNVCPSVTTETADWRRFHSEEFCGRFHSEECCDYTLLLLATELKRLVFLLHIQEDPSSSIGLKADYVKVVHHFPQSLKYL
jgi:hypothetical protein